jgi:two-component system, sensor histidine kinase and response regulator
MTGVPPLLDRAVIDDLVDAIGADGARSVINLFIAETQGHLSTIAAAAATDADPAKRDQARRAAHSLKSGAGQVGAAAVAAAAAEIERAATAGAALTEFAAALQRSAAETVIALEQFSAEG